MATASVKLYNIKELKEDKNFVVDDIEQYLATKTLIKTITDFQYQRFELYKKIKINLSQNNQLNSDSVSRITYVRIETPYSNSENAIYYYFVESINQISESTIELELKMDVLNTYKFTTSTLKNNNYKLSDRSLITREHKDRVGSLVSNVEGANLWGKHQVNLEEYYFLDTSDWTTGTDILVQCGGFGIPLIGHTSIELVLIKNDKQFYHFISISGFKYSKDANNQISLSSLTGNGNVDETYNFGVVFDKLYLRVMSWGTWATDARITLFLGAIYAYKCYAFYPRIIDKFQEGIESITFKHNEETLYESGSYFDDWYIAYSSANAVVDSPSDTQAKYVNPVQVDFISDEGYAISTITATVVRLYADSDKIPQYANYEEWLFVDLTKLEAGGYVEINGTQYDSTGFTYDGITYTSLSIQRKNNSDLQFARVCPARISSIVMYNNVSYVDFYGLNYCDVYKGLNNAITGGVVQQLYIGSGSSAITGVSDSFSEFDLTDPKLIKIICLPYAPRDDLKDFGSEPLSSELVWNGTLNCLELKNAQVNGFNRTINFADNKSPMNKCCLWLDQLSNSLKDASFDRYPRNIEFESKLYHSDYFIPKFVYDSFAFSFNLENIDVSDFISEEFYKIFQVQYVVSGNVQSKFMFKFNQYVCDRELEDYNDVLLVDRNNEKAIFNNAYINYIRSGGFRYDSKNADTKKMLNALSIPLAGLAAGAGVGAMMGASTAPSALKIAGAVVGAVVGVATKTISAIHSAQQNDREISQKLLSASQQSTSVSTSEDIDILKAYSNNKAKLCYYEVSSYLKDALWDLFHYFGYKCQYYGIPNVSTRCNFNFVQGEVILKEYTFNEDIANELTNKWKEGITFIHHNTSGWDMEQEYENFETNLLS
ncbi:MAG: hypothetical protein J6S67_01140 [Methanobrevibacter sp.]|nr:hypothetical protein [Methanobrevibacter sp.]